MQREAKDMSGWLVSLAWHQLPWATQLSRRLSPGDTTPCTDIQPCRVRICPICKSERLGKKARTSLERAPCRNRAAAAAQPSLSGWCAYPSGIIVFRGFVVVAGLFLRAAAGAGSQSKETNAMAARGRSPLSHLALWVSGSRELAWRSLRPSACVPASTANGYCGNDVAAFTCLS